MKVSLLAQVLVVALCLIGSQVSAQTNTTVSITVSNSYSTSYSISVSNSYSTSYSNSYSNSYSTSISNSFSTSISNTYSISLSTGSNYAPVTGLMDTCNTNANQICLSFTAPTNNPPYTSYVVSFVPTSGGATQTVTTTTNSVTLSSANGLVPGTSYSFTVNGVVNGVRGPPSQALVEALPALVGQGSNPNRIMNVVCAPNGNNIACTWSNGKKKFSKVRLLVRCSLPTYDNFSSAFFVSTTNNALTSIQSQSPVLPQGSGTLQCDVILRAIYPEVPMYPNSKYRFHYSITF